MMILIMVKNRMKLRPMNKMIILIRERIVDTNSIFILWIIIMTKLASKADRTKLKIKKMLRDIYEHHFVVVKAVLQGIVLLCIVEAGQELLMLRVA